MRTGPSAPAADHHPNARRPRIPQATAVHIGHQFGITSDSFRCQFSSARCADICDAILTVKTIIWFPFIALQLLRGL